MQEAADHGLAVLTPDELQFIANLRNRGWAICIFADWEIGTANPSEVEDAMIEAGWDWINEHQ